MPRYKLTIEYDGAGFVGWQRQANGPSIQEALERAAAPLGCRPGGLHGAGRTDSGVHATRQVAHLDLPKPYRTERVGDGFDARHSAIRRRYLYRIVNRRAPLALDAGQRWLVKPALDAAAMHEAAQGLLGMHDFTTFRDSECQAASPVRTLDGFSVERDGEAVEVRVRARSFLHRQVRSMVGSLALVGLGRWTAADLRGALDARDRRRCGPVAPADGLYLTDVDYP